MAKTKPVQFRTKLGTAKTVARSRIWIEGRRLVDAGFTVGRYYVRSWFAPEIVDTAVDDHTPTLTLELVNPNDVLSTDPCKVSGKGDKPIIDITGEMVRRVFGSLGTHVEVTYRKGVIVIRPAGD